MMKKKGSSLVLSLCIISVLMILAFVLISQVAAAYRFTVKNEQKDKLTLLAESGVEKALVAIKEKIAATPEIFDTESASFAPSRNFEFIENDINTTVTFTFDRGHDGIDYSKGYYVKIVSEAVNSTTSGRKKITAFILKKDISNAYYDTMFGNVLTTLDEVNGNINSSFKMQNETNPLILDGNLYLQGGTIDIRPRSLSYSSGKIVVNGVRLTTKTGIGNFANIINVREDTIVDNAIKDDVIKISPDYLPILTVKSVDTDPTLDNDLMNFYVDDEGHQRYTNPNPDYIVKATKESDANGATLVTFKIAPRPGVTPAAFNWSSFVQDAKDFIMRYMVKVNGHGYTGTRPANGSYGTSYENAYRGMYKVYLIDGDVIIATPSNVSGYINHVIYTEGKCTMQPGGNSFIKFENSSVMAKTIEVKYLNGSNTELHGIRKIDEVAGAGELSPFSAENRAKINKFCLVHLNGYADALRFKVHKWIEE